MLNLGGTNFVQRPSQTSSELVTGEETSMLDRIARLFRPEDAQKKASLALARLISQHNLETLPFREGVAPTRRKSDSQQVAVGVWLIPCEINAKDTVINFSAASPAITYDQRRSGIGVLSREVIKGGNVVVAMPDMESVWRFFECKIVHQSKRPGGWHLIGLFVQRIVEADPREVTGFRQQIGDLPERKVEEEYAARW